MLNAPLVDPGDVLGLEASSEGGEAIVVELIVDVPEEQRGFPNVGVSNNDHLLWLS